MASGFFIALNRIREPSGKVREYPRVTSECRDCMKERSRRYRTDTPERMRSAKLRNRLRKYGLSEEAYWAMWKEQEGRCAICREAEDWPKRSLCIDHDADSGTVRGLLCRACNVGIGNLRHNEDYLMAALGYLRQGFVGDDRCS